MLERGIRFSDVFVPQALTNVDVGDKVIPSLQGVWRRFMYFGRGIGGKYVTALDVTAPGPYTARAIDTEGPIPVWYRGNPDSPDGVVSNPASNNTVADRTAYSRMGQTWSIPVVGYMKPGYTSLRAGRGAIVHALFMGSGYGDTSTEGSTFYTLDALTGDVVAAPDVEATASSYGLTRSLPYSNAIVANPVGYNYANFVIGKTVHPAQNKVTRVYVGDLHGRLWKMLSAQPNTVIPVADLGADQPVGVAASLLGFPHTENPNQPPPPGQTPYILVSTGADSRAGGPFRVFTFRDEGSPTDTTTSGTVDKPWAEYCQGCHTTGFEVRDVPRFAE